MPPDDVARLGHMLEMADALERLTAGRRYPEMMSDLALALAMTRALEVLGEAAARLTEQRRSAAPDVPWREIIAMRNRLAHAYFDLNEQVIWDTATIEIPKLIGPIHRLLDEA